LREPFPPNQISKLPKPTTKDGKKGHCSECGGYHQLPAVHLSYVGHAALTDRLLDTDPLWFWEPVAFTEDGLPAFDKTGGLWIRLTVCGHSRLGYGHAEESQYKEIGSREKEVIGDALRNAAMRFGAALDLWHKGDLHMDDESTKETTKSADKPLQSAHTPRQGAFDKLTPDIQMQLRNIAMEVMGFFDKGDLTNTLNTLDSADITERDEFGELRGRDLEQDEKVALWDLFDAPTRTAITKERKRLKGV